MRLTRGKNTSKLRVGLFAGLASGVGAAAFTLIRRWARRRAARRNADFARATEGLWPAVPQRPASDVRIAADRADDGTPTPDGPSAAETAAGGAATAASPADDGPGEHATGGEEPMGA